MFVAFIIFNLLKITHTTKCNTSVIGQTLKTSTWVFQMKFLIIIQGNSIPMPEHHWMKEYEDNVDTVSCIFTQGTEIQSSQPIAYSHLAQCTKIKTNGSYNLLAVVIKLLCLWALERYKKVNIFSVNVFINSWKTYES